MNDKTKFYLIALNCEIGFLICILVPILPNIIGPIAPIGALMLIAGAGASVINYYSSLGADDNGDK